MSFLQLIKAFMTNEVAGVPTGALVVGLFLVLGGVALLDVLAEKDDQEA